MRVEIAASISPTVSGVGSSLTIGTTLEGAFSESFKYTPVFDHPSLGTWTGHGAGTDHFVTTPSGTISHEIFNSKEGPVQIIEHLQLHTDAEGNVTVDRAFERHVGC
jgi:hypothetical protein